MLCVCVGPDEEAVFRSLRRPLRSLITRSKFEGVRVGACKTLALACFICSSDDDDTSETLDLLAEVFSRTSDGEGGGGGGDACSFGTSRERDKIGYP